jgi:hypothetical protein
MSIFLQLPCEEGGLATIEITNDGEMVFVDYDIEQDVVLEEMGYETPLCLEILREWERAPIDFLCRSDVIPTNLLGFVTCQWAAEALARNEALINQSIGCVKQMKALLGACRRFWSAKRGMPLKRVYSAKQQVLDCWNAYVNKRREGLTGVNWRPPFAGERTMDAVLGCASMIAEYVNEIEMVGGLQTPLQLPCEVAKAAMQSIVIHYPTVASHRHPFESDHKIFTESVWMIQEEIDEVNQKLALAALRVLERHG